MLLTACGDSPAEPVVEGIDLDALFADPSDAERAAVESDWAGREAIAEGIVVETQEQVPLPGGDVRLRVVSHLVDGHRHVGAVVEPATPPAEPIPVIVYLHGGDGGTSIEELLIVVTAFGISPSDYVLVAPSFRSETLRAAGSTWRSEGPASPWDRDVDDALGLLETVLATVPFADENRIVAVGLSRGGTVGLLMGIRDPRLRAVVSFFAPTDFFGPFAREIVREILLGGPPRDLPGLEALTRDLIVPLREGELEPDEVRLELLRRSPARFADRLPAVQLHHGTADARVPVQEAGHLADAMEALGRGPPEFEVHLYSGAGHNPVHMPASFQRTREFLMRTFEGASLP